MSNKRAEIRRWQKTLAKPETDRDRWFREGYEQGVRDTVMYGVYYGMRQVTTAFCVSARVVFGFGKDRMQKLLANAADTYAEMIRKKDSGTDHERMCRQWIIDETGVDPDEYSGGDWLEQYRDKMKTIKEIDRSING